MSNKIESLPSLRDIVQAHGLWADKSFGQNYLFDLNLTRKIARIPRDTQNITIIEVGPGPGGLTRALLLDTNAPRIIAIEKDKRFVDALAPLVAASDGRLTLVAGDALRVDMNAFPMPRAVMANLPYNVGTELLTGWLQRAHEFAFFTLMFQREVAERLVAKPGTKPYGRLSVLAQALCDVRIAMNVPPSAFTPPPKVTSSVVHLVPHDSGRSVNVKKLETVTAAAFGQRRKMLRQSMKQYIPALEACGIDSTLRAENLSVADFIRLSDHI